MYSNAHGALRIYNEALVTEIEHNFRAIMEYFSNKSCSAYSVRLNSLFSIQENSTFEKNVLMTKDFFSKLMCTHKNVIYTEIF